MPSFIDSCRLEPILRKELKVSSCGSLGCIPLFGFALSLVCWGQTNVAQVGNALQSNVSTPCSLWDGGAVHDATQLPDDQQGAVEPQRHHECDIPSLCSVSE